MNRSAGKIPVSIIRARNILVRQAKQYLEKNPWAFCHAMMLRAKYRGRIVNPTTDVLVEAFPRSANTYVVAALEICASRPLSVASHTHSVAHVKRAVSLGIPGVVIVRSAADAIVSLLIREPNMTINAAVGDYLRFYTALHDVADQVIVVTFEEVTSQFERLIMALRDQHSLKLVPHTNRELERVGVFERVERMDRSDSGQGLVRETHVARPSRLRSTLRAEIKANLDRSIWKDRIAECDAVAAALLMRARRI